MPFRYRGRIPLRILFADALVRVHHDDADVRLFDRRKRADNAVAFHIIVDLAAFSHSGGVDNNIFLPVLGKFGVDRVSRRAGNVADNDPLLAQNAVDKAGFSGVRLSGNGDLYRVVLLVVIICRIEI